MKKMLHPYHLVTPSPWPILLALSIFNNLICISSWFNFKNYYILITLIPSILCVYLWYQDIIREATFQGCHTFKVLMNMQLGMILFIISEIFFFTSFFWAYFHSSLAPSMDIGQLWPPLGIKPFNPFDIPLLNTMILISSGLTVTWSHHATLNNNFYESLKGLIITIMLGLIFTMFQLIEYKESTFSISDSIYGSTFFISTGFHGIHVIIGTILLMITMIRMYLNHFSTYHHFGFEASIWYWHFVDVVWLFLFLSVYWWSF